MRAFDNFMMQAGVPISLISINRISGGAYILKPVIRGTAAQWPPSKQGVISVKLTKPDGRAKQSAEAAFLRGLADKLSNVTAEKFQKVESADDEIFQGFLSDASTRY
jgi:hypothetical protein